MTLAGRKSRPNHAEASASQGVDSVSKSNVKVVVRIRPENQLERDANSQVIVQYMSENVLVFDPKEQGSPEYGYRNRRRPRDIRRRQNKDLRFAFDFVFGPNSKNHEVYEQSTKQILNSFLNGYNCSVFAYGATGAGKTHTMLGSPQQPGVMYLTMMELYSRMSAIEADKTCDIAVSYLEVYNEQIHDLLMPGGSLPVREDSRNGVVVPGLSLHKPRTADELLHMLHFGNQNRTQHPTDANAESSRSHAVFQVFIKQRDRTANVSTVVKIAKMCLVDLAGSERATVTKNRGARFREGANINRSLLALGNVINALADSKYKGHVPYRDSKLTRLLKDSLGGNCQTCMIAAVSPSSLTYEDTYNTLKYADRAKHIQSSLKKNLLNVDFHVAKYGQIIEELRAEIVELKDKLRYYEEGKIVTNSTTNHVEICRLREKLDNLFGTRLKMCHEQLDIEMKSRDMQWKIYRKEKYLSWMALVSDMHQNGLGDRIKKTVISSRQRLQSFQKKKEETTQRLEDNKKNMKDLELSVQDQINGSGDQMTSEILKSSLEYHQTNLHLTEAQYTVKYFKRVVKSQEKEIQSNERLIVKLLQCLKQQHEILEKQNLVTSDLESHYHCIQSLVGGREVSFADQSYCSTSETNKSVNGIEFSDLMNFSGTGAVTEAVNAVLPTSQQTTQPLITQSFSQTSDVHSAGGAKRIVQKEPSIGLPMRVDSENKVHVLNSNEPSTANHQRGAVTSSSSNAEPKYIIHSHSILSTNSGVGSSVSESYDRTLPGHTVTLKSIEEQDKLSGFTGSAQIYDSEMKSMPESSVKTTLFAGHTPAPKKIGGMANDFGSVSMATAAKLNGQMDFACSSSQLGTGTASLVNKHVNNSSIIVNSSSKEVKSTNSSHDLNSTFTLNSISAGMSSQTAKTPVLNKSSSLDSTFTLAADSQSESCTGMEKIASNVSQDLNSTFTLNDTELRNPVISARTPVIDGKYCKYRYNNKQSVENIVNRTDVNYVNGGVNICVQNVTNHCEGAQCSTSTSQLKEIKSQTVSNTDVSTNINKPINKLLENVKNYQPVQSQTVTKSKDTLQVNTHTVTKSKSLNDHDENCNPKSLDGKEKGHCVRSIAFDNIANTPDKGRSYADAVRTPPVGTPTRPPLRQVNGNSSPLATVLTPNKCQQNPNTPDQGTGSSDLKPQSLFSQKSWDESTKENMKTLQQFGLPSFTDRPPKADRTTAQPKYMQTTKSVAHRYRDLPRYPSKIFTRTKFQIPSDEGETYRKSLSKHSQSTSSLHRRGWQI